jgi:hypothetical protein
MPIPATFKYNRLGIGVFGRVVGTEKRGENADPTALPGSAVERSVVFPQVHIKNVV